jgi:YD repeat-containing protein
VVTATTNAAPDPSRVSTTTLDSMGRVSTVVAANGATTTTTYDSHGRVYTVSNPSSSPAGATTYYYDALDRSTIQMQPDQSSRPVSMPWSLPMKWETSGSERAMD